MKNGNGSNGSNGHWKDKIKQERKVSKIGNQKAAARNVRLSGEAGKLALRNGGGSASARLAQQLARRIGKLIKTKGNDWYVYDGVKWARLEGGRNTYKSHAIKVQELGSSNARRADDILKYVEYNYQLGEGEEFVGAINHNALIAGEGNYLLNFENGVWKIDRRTGELVEWLKHKPEYMFTANLGEYVEGKDCEVFKEALKQVLPRKEDRVLLLNFFASALLPDTRFECALFCIGNGSNGKSVITEALAEAIGHDVRSAVTFHQICANDRKYVHKLVNKMINVSTETECRMVEENAIFKNVVSGEAFETDRLYQESFIMQTFCKLCFLTNHPPQFKFGTEAENRRLRFIQFTKRFDEESRDLLLREKLLADSQGILAMLVRRIPRICKLQELGKGSNISETALENFQISNDIVGSFLANCTQRCHSLYSAPKNNLYRAFQEYCRQREGSCRLTSLQFFNAVKKSYPETSRRLQVRCGRNFVTDACRGVQLSQTGMEIISELVTPTSNCHKKLPGNSKWII